MAAGAEPVRSFVERALYDASSGFYETGGRAGRRGASFVTSPETGPLFGAVVARFLDACWDERGRPERFTVVDAGAGPGTLVRSIRAAGPRCAEALQLVCVERSAAQRALHPEGVESRPDLPPGADVVIANELLDNLPFDLIERTPEGWREVSVGPDGTTIPDSGGPRAPVAAAAAAWVGRARAIAPVVVAWDYCDRTDALAVRPWTHWVRAFAGHEQLEQPFAAAGSRDITVVVPLDQLPVPDEVLPQAAWLRRWGIDELVAEGRAHWSAHAAAPDLRAVTMRSRVNEAAALVDPAGLGAFTTMEWRRPLAPVGAEATRRGRGGPGVR